MNDSFVNRMPAEWEAQEMVQLCWPDQTTDWAYVLEEAEACFLNIAKEISERQKLLLVARDIEAVKLKVQELLKMENVIFHQAPFNDTWARDTGALSIQTEEGISLLDFQFNGWGGKFDAALDNQLSQSIYAAGVFNGFVNDFETIPFILEGGSIESNGKGICLTTEQCLLSPKRNHSFSKESIEDFLNQELGFTDVLWLSNGALEGDDTDAHIDTLARFVNENTILYTVTDREDDSHFKSLKLMEHELKEMSDKEGLPFNLIAVPLPTAIFDAEDGHRLPATYANFLFINGAILLPIYGVPTDRQAIAIFEKHFPDHEIVPVNCEVLIRQHGSLHCLTMQYFKA